MRNRLGPLTVALVLWGPPLWAQTWVQGSTPDLGRLVEVDASGETGWPHGSEDVAGDGLDRYTSGEQLIDLRTVYAQTSGTELWVRAYVVGRRAPPETLTLFVFVDADHNQATGGSAAAEDLDDRLDEDPSDGGYEYVVVVPTDGTEARVHAWTPSASGYVEVAIDTAAPDVEIGQDFDSIREGASERGYVQVRVALAVVDLTSACDAALFVRSVSDDPTLDPGDLSLGDEAAECNAGDTNSDEIPDVAMPEGCTRDEQCPGDLICVSGECIFPAESPSCAVDADCSAGLACVGGECVRTGTTGTTGTATNTDTAGAAGNPSTMTLLEGQEVEGGACNCGVAGRRARLSAALALFAAGLSWRSRRRSRRTTTSSCPQ